MIRLGGFPAPLVKISQPVQSSQHHVAHLFAPGQRPLVECVAVAYKKMLEEVTAIKLNRPLQPLSTVFTGLGSAMGMVFTGCQKRIECGYVQPVIRF